MRSSSPTRERERGGNTVKRKLLWVLGTVAAVIVLFYLYLYLTA